MGAQRGKETESQDGRRRQTRNNNLTVSRFCSSFRNTHKNGTSVKTQLLIYLSRVALIY